MQKSQYALLGQRRFLPFFITQIAGALNDNLFKNVLILLATYQTAQYGSRLSPGMLANLAAAIFIFPYVVFSASAGQLADRYDKALLIRVIKLAEIAIMAVAAAGMMAHSLPLMLVALGGMGIHSTFFGPVKYSLLPQVLADSELVGGNALVEASTNVTILAGTMGAGILAGLMAPPEVLGGIMLLIALAGAAASFAIPRTGSAAPDLVVRWNLVRETVNLLRIARAERPIWLALIGISWFWFFGALFIAQFPALAKQALHGDPSVVTVLLTLFAVGVAIGSLLCERLSGRRVDIGLVPYGSIGMTLFGALTVYALPKQLPVALTAANLLSYHWAWGMCASLLLVGMFGGLYIVPLYAMVQQRTKKSEQSRVIAANNVLNAAFMVASAALAAGMLALGISVPHVLLVGVILNALAALYIYSLVPEFLWRFVVFLLVHTVYRVRAKGLLEAIPEEGPGLVVANHVSFVDALVVQSVISRPIRFIMDHGISEAPLLKYFFREIRAIPIASAKTHPEVYERAFASAREALANGELVAIFPEGKLTADGQINEFRPGYLKILQDGFEQVPVVALGLGGFWGSAFSRKEKSLWRRFSRRELFRRFGVLAGRVPHDVWSEPESLRSHLVTLQRESMAIRR